MITSAVFSDFSSFVDVPILFVVNNLLEFPHPRRRTL